MKVLKHCVPAGDIASLLAQFSELKRKALARTGLPFRSSSFRGSGSRQLLVHRVLQSERVESHVVDPASIATSRRRRRAKTDRIDGEALLRKRYWRSSVALNLACARWSRYRTSPGRRSDAASARERKVLIAERGQA